MTDEPRWQEPQEFLEDDDIIGLRTLYAALADTRRLEILDRLSFGACTVGILAHELELAMNVTSYHLKRLLDAGLVTSTTHEAYREYALTPAARALIRASNAVISARLEATLQP
jgi:DNA-binding transcriptional ArsR family regulator